MKYHPRAYKAFLIMAIAAFVGVISLSIVVLIDVLRDRDAVCEVISKGRNDNRTMWLRMADALQTQGNDTGSATVLMWLDESLPPINCVDGQPVEQLAGAPL